MCTFNFVLYKIVLAIQGPLQIHMNLITSFSISAKKDWEFVFKKALFKLQSNIVPRGNTVVHQFASF